MISYAQNREDVLLARLFPPGVNGFYIDVGANDPTIGSVTRHFYDHGWHGINIEPSSRGFNRLRDERTRDININAALSDRPGIATFYEFDPPWSGVSTFGRDQAVLHRDRGHPLVEHEVHLTTLAQICADHVDSTIDFLSIDVEGHEANVIRGGDWARWRPRAIVVEATEPTTSIPAHEGWEPQLLEAGYLYSTFDGLNRYYVREEDRALVSALSVPVSVLDDYVSHELSSCRSQLAASRALLESIREQMGRLPEELRSLQAQYQRLERVATRTRAEIEPVRNAVEEAKVATEHARARCRQLEDESAELIEQLRSLTALGPRTLEVARALRRTADRFPRATAAARRALGSARRRQWLPRR